MFNVNALTAVDSYKVGHIFQYPDGTILVDSNFTPRGDTHAVMKDSFVYDGNYVNFGLSAVIQFYLIDLWNNTFFNQDKDVVCNRYKRRCSQLLNVDFPVSHFEQLHDLGYLPLEILALPEGALLPIATPMFVIRNTHPNFSWLTNYVETALSACLWQACTGATSAYYFRKLIEHFQQLTGSPDFLIPYQGHDFGMRGMPLLTAAAFTGVGHLTSFVGTDNLLAIDFAEDYYGANADTEHVGESVEASEHSVMCIYGEDGELGVIERLLDDRPTGIISLVLDGFDFFKMVNDKLPSIKDKIVNRDGKLVIRPDSGNPVDILCGHIPTVDYGCLNSSLHLTLFKLETDFVESDGHFFEIVEGVAGWLTTTQVEFEQIPPEQLGLFRILDHWFGTVVNESGYKELIPQLGVIYGDSITFERCEEILSKLAEMGYASTPIFGLGSYFYQYHTRDDFAMAMKTTYVEIDNGNEIQRINVHKDPKTDDGTKRSRKGMLRVHIDEHGDYVTTDGHEEYQESELKLVFKDGVQYNKPTLSEIRQRLHNWDDRK